MISRRVSLCTMHFDSKKVIVVGGSAGMTFAGCRRFRRCREATAGAHQLISEMSPVPTDDRMLWASHPCDRSNACESTRATT
jgi:hypothetical protein